MKMNKNPLGRYASPTVLQVAEVVLERDFLAGPSATPIEPITVETTGQEVGGEYDYSSSDIHFNHEWGK